MADSTIMDLSCHRWDGSWAWFYEACNTFGNTTAVGMCEYMESIARHLNVGMSIDIPGMCHNEKKIPYAVKIACVIIETARRFVNGPQFEMNNTYTQLKRIA